MQTLAVVFVLIIRTVILEFCLAPFSVYIVIDFRTNNTYIVYWNYESSARKTIFIC